MSGLLSGQELFDIIPLFVFHLLRLHCWQPFHEIEVVSISFVKSACVVFTLFSLNLDRVFGIFLVVTILIDDVLFPEVIVERNLSVKSLPHHQVFGRIHHVFLVFGDVVEVATDFMLHPLHLSPPVVLQNVSNRPFSDFPVVLQYPSINI